MICIKIYKMEEYTPFIIWLIVIGIAVFIAGTVWHNLYLYNNKNPIIGMIAPVNESVWEHSKMVIYPILMVFLISQIFFYRITQNRWIALLLATIAGVVAMIVFYYLYIALFNPKGYESFMGHLITYFLAMVVGLFVLFHFLVKDKIKPAYNLISAILYVFLLTLTAFWSFYPPSSDWIWKF